MRADAVKAVEARTPPVLTETPAELDPKPLTAQALSHLFAGAPFFRVDDHGGHPRPQAEYGWGASAGEGRHATDYAAFGHVSFKACSVDDSASPSHGMSVTRAWATSLPEVPSMLSANGAELGTVGFAHFLQLPLADSTPQPDTYAMAEKRKLLVSDPEALGLRDYSLGRLLARLAELSVLHAVFTNGTREAAEWEGESIEEMGEDLFAMILSPDLAMSPTGTSSVSLMTQIIALQKVLTTADLWYNFSHIEWRIQLGRLLWADNDMQRNHDEEEELTDRDVLLLQIVLAAELLVRLEIVHTLSAFGSKSSATLSEDDLDAASNDRPDKVQWDLLLAERFMQNLSVVSKPSKPNKAMNRLSVFSLMSFRTAEENFEDPESDLMFQPNREEEQLDGLLSFARAIDWPELEDIKANLAAPRRVSSSPPRQIDSPVSGGSSYATPQGSPVVSSVRGKQRGVSGSLRITSTSTYSALERADTPQSVQDMLPATPKAAISLEAAGWLSRSWMSGLVLPGESASHFLISTLLENSSEATHALGYSADLYGGFLYRGRMYWSKSSIVGRVLAATNGAKECMGWISTAGVPDGRADGWIPTTVKRQPYASAQPRIKSPGAIARASDPLRGNDAAEVHAADFTTPLDSPLIMGNEAQFQGIQFVPAAAPSSSRYSTTSPSHIAQLTFTAPTNAKLPAVTIPLTHAVHFISSYPCYPSSRRQHRVIGSPSSRSGPASGTESPRSVSSIMNKEKELPPPPAHPLHKDFTFTVVPAATLLSAQARGSQEMVSPVDAESPTAAGSAAQLDDAEVAVLDCRGSPDLEVLVRAWCAKVGENAVVGRQDTCLSCCVREAMALGVGVVIRT